MVTKNTAAKTATTTGPRTVGKYAPVELPASVRKSVFTSPFSRQDSELIEALKESHTSGATYFQSLKETPDITRKGETRRPTAKEIEQYVRRHAGEAGVGVSVAHIEDGSGVYFTAQDKRVVKTGAERKPRATKAV